ncbi:hypothetical protein E4U40_000720 [Claviceps sp. LM458 group G5]|nr:hypothetical protein E4U40_000720 [Claviceps sp. LM458 group G5]
MDGVLGDLDPRRGQKTASRSLHTPESVNTLWHVRYKDLHGYNTIPHLGSCKNQHLPNRASVLSVARKREAPQSVGSRLRRAMMNLTLCKAQPERCRPLTLKFGIVVWHKDAGLLQIVRVVLCQWRFKTAPLLTVKISESAIASIGNGIGLSPEDLEFELGLGEQQLFTDLGKSVYLHLVVALGRWRCQWSLRIVRGFFWSIRDDAMKWNEAGRPKAWI